MNAKQLWEAARRTCVTIEDMTVDQESSALLRRIQAALRGDPQPRKAKQVYDRASLARDALTQGDKEDARRLLEELKALLEEAPEPSALKKDKGQPVQAVKEAAESTEPTQTESRSTTEDHPATPQKSAARRMLMPIFNKLRSAFGGEKGKQAAQRAMYTEEHENKEREIAEIEGKLDSLLAERDTLRTKLEAIVQKARGLDRNSFDYTKLKHEATLLKPKLDAIDGSIGTLMKRAEDLAKISANYQSVLLSMQNAIDEHAMIRTSVLVDQAAEQIDLAADQDRELHKMAARTDQLHQQILSQSAESEPNFFDDLVSGGQKAVQEEEDPFDQMVAEANQSAEKETSAGSDSAETPDEPKAEPENPLEL